jgi:hypothetical protein
MPPTACGTPMHFQGLNRPLHVWLHMMIGSTKAIARKSYEKCTTNWREQTHGWSRKSVKHPTPCEKHGGMRETAWGENHCTNEKLWIKEWNVSCQVDRNRKSTSSTECTNTQLSLRIKKIERLQQKILQWIKKQSCHHGNDNDNSSTSCCEHPNTTRECSHKSKKARRYPISPDTPFHQRQVKTGEFKSKINSNLNHEIISKPVNSKENPKIKWNIYFG